MCQDKRQRQNRPGETAGNKVLLTPEISTMQRFIPFDLIIEIFVRLPVKSLLRFKCVSKLWRETIQERSFIDKNRRRVSSRATAYEEDRNTFIYLDSIHGLMLEKSKYTDKHQIRNPSTKQIFHLPTPPDKYRYHMRIIYVPTDDKYKLTYLNYEQRTGSAVCRVLTVGIDLHWRSITKLQASAKRDINTKKINDMLFIFQKASSEIVCIEMASECFVTVEIPLTLFSDWKDVRVFRWNDMFSLARVDGEKLTFWVLEDYKNNKWAGRKHVISLDILRKHPNSSQLMRSCPDFRKLWFDYLIYNWMYIFLDDDENDISYNVQSGTVCVFSSPPGKKIYGNYSQSLVHIQGMQNEETSERRQDVS